MRATLETILILTLLCLGIMAGVVDKILKGNQ